MTSLPSRLKIGRHWWTVEAVDCRRIRYGSRLVRGLCHYDKRLIQVCVRQGERAIRQTLIHELLHALSLESKVPIPEWMCHALEAYVAALLWKNPELMLVLSQSPTSLKPGGKIA